jgi:hypothetical protein
MEVLLADQTRDEKKNQESLAADNVSPASAFFPEVICVNPASAFRIRVNPVPLVTD